MSISHFHFFLQSASMAICFSNQIFLYGYAFRNLTVYSPAERVGSPTIVNYDFGLQFCPALALSTAKSGAIGVGQLIFFNYGDP